MKRQSGSYLRRISIEVILCFFLFLVFLAAYIIQINKSSSLYYKDYLSTAIDISKPGEQFKLELSDVNPENLCRIKLQVPALAAALNAYDGVFDKKTISELNFLLKISLQTDGYDLFVDYFKTGADALSSNFLLKYETSKDLKTPLYLVVDVIKAQEFGSYSIITINADGSPLNSLLKADFYRLLTRFSGILLLVALLEFFLRRRIKRKRRKIKPFWGLKFVEIVAIVLAVVVVLLVFQLVTFLQSYSGQLWNRFEKNMIRRVDTVIEKEKDNFKESKDSDKLKEMYRAYQKYKNDVDKR